MCWVQGIYLDRHRVLNSETDAPCCFQSEIEETKPAGIVAAPVVDTCGIGLTLPVPRTEEPTVLDTSAQRAAVGSASPPAPSPRFEEQLQGPGAPAPGLKMPQSRLRRPIVIRPGESGYEDFKRSVQAKFNHYDEDKQGVLGDREAVHLAVDMYTTLHPTKHLSF